MSDLMNCQLCGSEACYVSDVFKSAFNATDYPWEQVTCSCGARSPEAKWDSSYDVTPKWYPSHTSEAIGGVSYFNFRDGQRAKHRPSAAEAWNNMQKLLARGLILDEPAKSKGNRL